jgi:anti-anti-sigma factor
MLAELMEPVKETVIIVLATAECGEGRAERWPIGLGTRPMLRHTETPDKIIVCFTDAKLLDACQGQGLFNFCRRAASAHKKLTVDFRGVQCMSSAMIRQLASLNRLARSQALDLRLANVGHNLMEVFKFTGLDKVFRFDDDGSDLLGSPVPLPKPPNTDSARAEPPGD